MIIWKYELAITEIQTLTIPCMAKILSVANQNGKLCLWVMVQPANKTEERNIEIIGTGRSISVANRKFLDTVIMNPFVWHVFERLN